MHPNWRWGRACVRWPLDRWQEPSRKDIVVLYGAEIYLRLDLGYRIITADEAAAILERCRDAGLVHSLDFCMQSGRWHFVICNCDREICVLVRTFLLTGKMIYPGPFIVKQDRERCLGPDACGQCVRICRGKARELVRRARYAHEKVVPAQVLLDGVTSPSGTSGPAA
jgi:hypothetical protein